MFSFYMLMINNAADLLYKTVPLKNPEEFRQAVRKNVAERFRRIPEGDEKEIFIDNFVKSKENPDTLWTERIPSNEYSDVYNEEQGNFVDEQLKSLGIRIANRTQSAISNNILFEILNGIMNTLKHFPKSPTIVEFKDLGFNSKGRKIFGLYDPEKSMTIFIDSHIKDQQVLPVVVHEITHENDPSLFNESILDNILLIFHSSKIKKEIRSYALTDRSEFVACTAEKLVSEGKTWNDLDPKIYKLYKHFNGPKLDLPEKIEQ